MRLLAPKLSVTMELIFKRLRSPKKANTVPALSVSPVSKKIMSTGKNINIAAFFDSPSNTALAQYIL